MVPRVLFLTLAFALPPLAAPAGHVAIQRPFPPRAGVIVPVVAPRLDGTRPFFRHHHRVFFVPLVVVGNGFSTCEATAFSRDDAARSPIGDEHDLIIAYVERIEAATTLLYGLRAAGYPDARIVSLQFDPSSRYRAEFRLERHDTSPC